jgi:hypothetical protein
MMKRMIFPLVLVLCSTAVHADEKNIVVSLTVPDTTWTVAIDEVYRVGDELWVISTVSHDPHVMGAQVISTVQDSLRLTVPDLPVKFFITGKTWNWTNEEPYTFMEDLKEIESKLKSGKLVYKAGKPGPCSKE